jgi:acyl carrier protein
MGLELVEIIMDLEDALGVPVDWTGQVRTVGDLQQAVTDAVVRAYTLSSEEVRQHYEAEVMSGLAISRADLDRPIGAVVHDLRQRLPVLAMATWWDLPSRMRRPVIVVYALWAITPVATVALFLSSPQDRTVAIAGLIFGPMASAFGAFLTDNWRPRMPEIGASTPRMLVDRAVARSRPRKLEVLETWMSNGVVKRSALDAKVIAIVADRGGRKPATIKPTDRLVEDLGLG